MATEVVRVGTYPFLPFVDNGTGLTYDLVKTMNVFRNNYQFQRSDVAVITKSYLILEPLRANYGLGN